MPGHSISWKLHCMTGKKEESPDLQGLYTRRVHGQQNISNLQKERRKDASDTKKWAFFLEEGKKYPSQLQQVLSHKTSCVLFTCLVSSSSSSSSSFSTDDDRSMQAADTLLMRANKRMEKKSWKREKNPQMHLCCQVSSVLSGFKIKFKPNKEEEGVGHSTAQHSRSENSYFVWNWN